MLIGAFHSQGNSLRFSNSLAGKQGIPDYTEHETRAMDSGVRSLQRTVYQLAHCDGFQEKHSNPETPDADQRATSAKALVF